MMFCIVCVKLKDLEGIAAKESEGIKKQILNPPTACEAEIIMENPKMLKVKKGNSEGHCVLVFLKFPSQSNT